MSDVLGRHAYTADAAWSGARGVPDWHASYAYDRWWPTLFAAYSDDTDPTSLGDSRARELLTGAVLPIRHLRWAETGLAALNFEADASAASRPCSRFAFIVSSARFATGWIHDSRRQFGYSISAEEGVQIEGASRCGHRPRLARMPTRRPSCSTCVASSESSGGIRSWPDASRLPAHRAILKDVGCFPPPDRARLLRPSISGATPSAFCAVSPPKTSSARAQRS